jgi:hypothetical protein
VHNRHFHSAGQLGNAADISRGDYVRGRGFDVGYLTIAQSAREFRL